MLRSLENFFANLYLLLIFVFAKKSYARVTKNLELIYGLKASSIWSRKFSRDHFRFQFLNLFWCLLELLDIKKYHIENSQEFRSVLENLMKSSKGVVFVTAHLGCWEHCAKITAGYGLGKFNALAKPSKYLWITKLLEKMRAKAGVRVLWTDRKTLLKDMLHVLKANEFLGFVMDQKPKARQGITVRFMGRDTEFVSGPARISLQLGTPVVSLYILRISKYRLRLVYEIFRTDISKEDPQILNEQELTQRIASHMEQIIFEYPEQWLWEYKRWKNV